MTLLRSSIGEIQTLIAGLAGVRQAPTDPRDELNVFPFAVCFPNTGSSVARPIDDQTALHNLTLEIHTARKSLTRDMTTLYPYPELVANALYGNNGKWSNFNSVNNITYELTSGVWGSIQTLVYRFVVQIKIREALFNPTPPVADFVGDPLAGSAPLLVDFTDLSANNPSEWLWSFGDTNTSTLQNPQNNYTNQGVYTVSLDASSGSGSDNETKIGYIVVSSPFLFQDTFTDTNGVLIENHTPNVDSQGGGWVKVLNDIDIQSNRANKSLSASVLYIADMGQTNMTVDVTVNMQDAGAGRFQGLICRSSADALTRFDCLISAGSNASRIIENGVTIRASGTPTINTSQDYSLEAVCSGSSITFTIDGGNTLSYNSAGNSQNHAGLIVQGGAAQANQYQWDDFEVTS